MSHSINGHFTPISLLKFAAPSIIMMMFMSLYTIIDGIFISRFVGSNALSSLNIVYPIINIVFAIGTMLGTGGNAIISRYMGEGKNKTAKECMTQFVVIGLIISVIILVLTRLNLSSISRILGASDLLLADCNSYLAMVISFAPMSFPVLFCYCRTSESRTLSDNDRRYPECSFRLCIHCCLSDGHQRCRSRHRYRTDGSCCFRPRILLIFQRKSTFHPPFTSSERVHAGLL